MRIIEYKYPAAAPLIKERVAVCLGFFDGVHLGHRALIRDTVERATERGLLPTVFTFPSQTPEIKRGAARIYGTGEKLSIFEELGVEAVVLCDFASVSSLSPRDFVREVLVRDVGAGLALAGEDFRFGYRASGDSSELSRLMREVGGEAVIHETEYYDLPCGRVQISATLIREYLSRGEVGVAAELLGSPYRISGEIVSDRKAGRGYGYPTINTELPDGAPLARGVYHTDVKIGGKRYTGLTNVGTCPTFGERAPHAETYLLDFSGEVYGEVAEISFIGYIREERTFGSPEELAREIEKNIKEVLSQKERTRGD